jgi:hypothetical protein
MMAVHMKLKREKRRKERRGNCQAGRKGWKRDDAVGKGSWRVFPFSAGWI